jgi:hypothetical protein
MAENHVQGPLLTQSNAGKEVGGDRCRWITSRAVLWIAGTEKGERNEILGILGFAIDEDVSDGMTS